MLKTLEESRWLDVLETSPLVAGDARFLREYFLPAHGQYEERRYQAALAELDRRLARGASADLLAARGRVRRLLGDRTGAGADFEAALSLDPACAAARAYRAESALVADPGSARAELERAVEAAPRGAYYRLWLGYALALAGETAAALGALDAALALDPKIRAARILRGILRERGEDLAGAEKDYSAVAKLRPRCPGVYTLRATVRWKRGDFKRSVADAQRALLFHPENLDAFMRIVYLYKSLKHPEEKRSQGAMVAQIADELLRADPRCAWAYALKAEVVEEGRVIKKAEKKTRFHERAVKLDPRNAWMQAFLGRSLSGLRKNPRWVRRGLKHLDRAVALRPDVGWIRSWRAEVLDKLGEERRALTDLDRGIAADPYYRLANAWRAALRERLGDDEGALEDLTACLAVMPRPGFFHQRALILWRLGREPEAAADLTRCLGLTTKLALAYGPFAWLLRFEWGGTSRPGSSRTPLRARAEIRRSQGARAVPRGGLRLAPLDLAAVHSLIKQLPGSSLKSPWKGLELDAERLAGLCAANPRDGRLFAWCGRARLDAGALETAEEALGSAVELDGASFAAYSWRGEARFRRGELAGSLADLDRAIALKPAYLPSYFWRSLAHLASGQEARALEDLLGACRADPASAIRIAVWARWTIPGFWSRMRRGGPALPLAEFALMAGQYSRAALLLRREAASGLGAEGWIVLGLASGQSGRTDLAETEFSRGICADARAAAAKLVLSLKLMPQIRREVVVSAYYALAEAEALAGREAESARAFATALELDVRGAEGGGPKRTPGLAAALMMRARVKRETGDLQGALDDARKAGLLKGKPLTQTGGDVILAKTPVKGGDR